MFPDFNFVDCVMMLLGLLLCLKRVAQMERYHNLRVVIFTSIFGVIVVFSIIAFRSTLYNQFQYDYSEGTDQY